jgi:hypothetical protein
LCLGFTQDEISSPIIDKKLEIPLSIIDNQFKNALDLINFAIHAGKREASLVYSNIKIVDFLHIMGQKGIFSFASFVLDLTYRSCAFE